MSFGRKLLKSLSLTDEQIDAIIEAHTEVTDSMKASIESLTEKAQKAEELQKELDKLTAEDWQKKFTDKEKEFSAYKASVESKEKETAIKAAYRNLLIDQKVGERQLDAILKITDFSGMKLDGDGKLVDADKLAESIKKDYAGFITTEELRGVGVQNPPGGGGSSGGSSRAAEIAKRFHEQRYGKAQEKQ